MKRESVSYYVTGVQHGDRNVLSRAISIVESSRMDDMELSNQILSSLGESKVDSLRIGVTGSPGVGKSTFIESIGQVMINKGHRVAILAIDPSSAQTGGSILGDKTRMNELSKKQEAFIRPSATYNYYGGVNQNTYKTIKLCEAAGYDRILVETVGVGQSEYLIKSMVDFFLLLAQPASGDELQGIKKGVMEMADAIVVNKSDGDLIKQAQITKSYLEEALHYRSNSDSIVEPKVICCSSLSGERIGEVDKLIENSCELYKESDLFDKNRLEQEKAGFSRSVEEAMLLRIQENLDIENRKKIMIDKMTQDRVGPFDAANDFMTWFKNKYSI